MIFVICIFFIQNISCSDIPLFKDETPSVIHEKKRLAIHDTSAPLKIVRKLLNYTPERKQLSIAYLEKRHGIFQSSPTIRPCMIVLHYTGGGSNKSIYNYFNQINIEDGRKYNKQQSKLNVSSHYSIDRNGTVYQLVEDTLFARHTIGLNYCAIGIENIGGPNNPLTKEQVKANADLIRLLSGKHPIKYVIGHSEYGAFRKSDLWKETEASYFTQKQDPGIDFLKDVRKRIADLKLKYTP